MFKRIKETFKSLIKLFFKKKGELSLGFYGSPNTGKTTLANKICTDLGGEPLGVVSIIPHETRLVQKKEKLKMRINGNQLVMNILDMPGIAVKVDYRDFMAYGLSSKEAQARAKEATKGIVEAIKHLESVNAALVVMDATEEPYNQINATILGNLEAKSIPILIVANKMDRVEANSQRIKEVFPQYPVVEVSALTGKNMDSLYSAILKKLS
ncbi:GTP-binding protein [Candidatus Micrarchaeota archaeon CG11_big_fil_rev_8_21_14_0_20_47_5]|nr:MAG: GTP-binding protein [Candidatus Micrarchaeota archaeon CG1_02_47_40]PIN83122.1 MAG: GTP-binding protein [Candidatus Micrarchaeota archaeon CG11_big_fil_rev_8_21_14_0_20_47_5]